jgi:8-oxo-dGTP pyrophosphatase MutT (NUDIX family)
MSSAGSFVVDVFGEFAPGQVRIRWHGDAAPVDPQIEQLKAAWPEQVEAVRRRGGVLFNGPMVGYRGHRLEGGTLFFEAGPTDYATFLCTNYLNHALGDRIGWHKFANPIGISANVITDDGWVLYGRRGDRVAIHPNMIHTFGGTIEPGDRTPDGEVDAFASMRRELEEELRLAPAELVELVCLGMLHDAELHQPELIFDARIACSRAELAARLTPDDPEHAAIAACADRPEAYASWPDSSCPVAPVALGALRLHARRMSGGAFIG